MTTKQKQSISNAMETYKLFLDTGIPTFTSQHFDKVRQVRKELGLRTDVCLDCTDRHYKFFNEIYELYKVQN